MNPVAGQPYEPFLTRYLERVRAVLPADAVLGIYLTGSATLGDYHHGRSDLDPLVVTTRPLAPAELGALERLHAELETGAQPHLDVTYLSSSSIGTQPATDQGIGYVIDGQFHAGAEGQELVLWANLAQCGVTLFGADAAELDAAPDPEELKRWTQGNLDSYWRAQAQGLRDELAEVPDEEELPASVAEWVGAGPGRLLCTVETGQLISKSASIEYLSTRFSEFSELLRRVRATRQGDASQRYARSDGLALAELIDRICAAAAVA